MLILIANWLRDSYKERTLLSGIIYVHCISDPRSINAVFWMPSLDLEFSDMDTTDRFDILNPNWVPCGPAADSLILRPTLPPCLVHYGYDYYEVRPVVFDNHVRKPSSINEFVLTSSRLVSFVGQLRCISLPLSSKEA